MAATLLLHVYDQQHQRLPLLAFDGDTKFPLAGRLRSGTEHPSWGAMRVREQVQRRNVTRDVGVS